MSKTKVGATNPKQLSLSVEVKPSVINNVVVATRLPKTSFMNTTPTPKLRAINKEVPPLPGKPSFIPNKNELKILEKVTANVNSVEVDSAYGDFSTLHKVTNKGLPSKLLRMLVDYSHAFHTKHGSFPSFACSDLMIMLDGVIQNGEVTDKVARHVVNRLHDLGHISDGFTRSGFISVNLDSMRQVITKRSGL